MYVHIGKECVINSDNIVAIFNIKAITKKKELKEICNNMRISDNIIDVSDNNKKTLILYKINKNIKGYITNISSNTIAKRCNLKVC